MRKHEPALIPKHAGPDGEAERALGGKPKDRGSIASKPNNVYILTCIYLGSVPGWNSLNLADIGSQRQWPKAFDGQTFITAVNSLTAAALFSRPAFSSAVNLISMICSIPLAPSFTGTPT